MAKEKVNGGWGTRCNSCCHSDFYSYTRNLGMTLRFGVCPYPFCNLGIDDAENCTEFCSGSKMEMQKEFDKKFPKQEISPYQEGQYSWEVGRELRGALKKFPRRSSTIAESVCVMAEEMGEVVKEVNELTLEAMRDADPNLPCRSGAGKKAILSKMRKETLQTMAMGYRLLEHIDEELGG